MYIQFQLQKVFAEKSGESSFFDPFNTKSEWYQTWQICELEALTEDHDLNQKVDWAKQGFSVIGSPYDAPSYGDNEEREINDPKISFNLPDLPEGKQIDIRLDIHWWESDSSTAKVRGAFTDSTLKVLMKAWEESGKDEQKAREELEKWLSNNGSDLIKTISRVADVSEQTWLKIGMEILPLFSLIVDVVRKNSDDYLWMHRFIFQIRKKDGVFEWRITSNNNVDEWKKAEKSEVIKLKGEDKDRENVAVATYICSVFD